MALAKEIYQAFEDVVERADGSVAYLQVSYVPELAAGAVRGFAVEITDVSALRRAAFTGFFAPTDGVVSNCGLCRQDRPSGPAPGACAPAGDGRSAPHRRPCNER